MPKIVNFFKCVCRYFCGQGLATSDFTYGCVFSGEIAHFG